MSCFWVGFDGFKRVFLIKLCIWFFKGFECFVSDSNVSAESILAKLLDLTTPMSVWNLQLATAY